MGTYSGGNNIYLESNGNLALHADIGGVTASSTMTFNVDGSTAMTINSDLKVGIGVTPTNFVDIQKDQNAATVCQIKNNTGGTGAFAGFAVSSNSSAGGLNAYDDGYTTNTEYTDKVLLYADTNTTALMLMAAKSDGVIEFYTGGYTATSYKRMTIAADGNVGIGKSPAYLLDMIKSWEGGTVSYLTNATASAGAYAAYILATNDCDGGMYNYGSSYTSNLQYTSKTLVYSSKVLMLTSSLATTGAIEFYAGGVAAANKIGWVHTGGIKADNRNFSSASLALGDDVATSITPVNTTGQIVISCKVSSTGAIIAYKVGASPTCLVIAQPGAVFSVGTGTLTDGTTDGTDGTFNVYTHTDGKIYFKNRYGAG